MHINVYRINGYLLNLRLQTYTPPFYPLFNNLATLWSPKFVAL
jgi:hypothetical protein